MGETIRAQYRGRAVGCVQSGWAVGWGAAVLAQAVLFTLLPADTAWRAMFALGVAPALLVFYLRRHVREPEIATAARARLAAAGRQPPIWEIFGPGILRTTLLASMLATGAQGGYYSITAWLPTYLKIEHHLSVVGSTGYLALLIAGCFAGYLVGAWLADRIGRRRMFIVFAVGALLLIVAYTQLGISNDAMRVLGFPLGFFASGYFAALAITIFAVIAYGIMLAAALMLPETRGRRLETDG